MTHERDQAHTLATATPNTDLDTDLAPGRATRTSALHGPTGPRPSGLLMRKAARDENGVAAHAAHAVGAASASSGAALPEDLRSRFEGSLGTDLSSVRVHTGAPSADAASAVGARAYTFGNDIHFAAGQYDPGSASGQHLLAHEVAHTVQQRGGSATPQYKLEVSAPGDHFEHEADRAADAMVTGAPTTVGSATGIGRLVQRKEGGVEASSAVAVTKHSVKATAKAEVMKKFTFNWVSVEAGGEVTIDGTLQDKVAGKEQAKDKAEKPTGELEAHKAEAEQNGAASLKTQVEAGIEEQKSDFEAEWESPEVEATGPSEGGLSITVNLKVHGVRIPVKFTGVELAKGKMEFAAIELQVPIKLKEATLWQNDDMKFVAAGTVTTKVKIQPNMDKIMEKVAEQYADKLRPFAMQMLETMFGEAGIAGGLILIAGTTLAALLIGASELASIDAAAARAHAALRRYGDGFSTGLGVTRNTSSSPLCFDEGRNEAQSALTAQITKLQAHPVFKAFKFTPAELKAAILEKAAPQVPELTKQAMAKAQPVLFARFANEFYNNEMNSLFGSYSNAYALASLLGVPDAIPARKE